VSTQARDTHVTEVENDFPAWGVWISDTGNWWASPRGALTLAQITAGCTPFLRADTADGLRSDLRDQEALMIQAEATR